MQNAQLLHRHRQKLSVYFALFVLCILWITEGIFLVTSYTAGNLRLFSKIESRLSWVRNIIENRSSFSEKIQKNGALLWVVDRALQGVTIYEDTHKILGDLDVSLFPKWGFFGKTLWSRESVFYRADFVFENMNYTVLIEAGNEYSPFKGLEEMLLFILLSLPLSVIFYGIGYFFVWKNLRVIEETMDSLEDFSSHINHEIRTPLSEIISTLGLAKHMPLNYDEAIAQTLQSAMRIEKILDSMEGLVQLVDASYQKERMDLGKEIERIVEDTTDYAQSKQVTIRFSASLESYKIKANRAHIDICVGNIIKNAIKYSPQWGEVVVTFSDGLLRIQDHGIGIDEKNLPHIFDRYFRENYTREEGFWLGLALVKKIVDRNGYRIQIESKKQEGTTVSIDFSTP